MTRFANHALAACAAFVLSMVSIGSIVTVPPAEAAAPASLNSAEMA